MRSSSSGAFARAGGGGGGGFGGLLGGAGGGGAEQRRYAALGAALVCVMVLLVLASSSPATAAASLAHLRSDSFPDVFRIAVIADLDQASKRPDKAEWFSLYMTGTLTRKGERYAVAWDAPAEVATPLNEAGRGCELSELVRFNDRLLTFDDRTGLVFEVHGGDRSDAAGASAPHLQPVALFTEGDGASSAKGMKVEWATVKDGVLVVGSFGKEYTNARGEVLHTNNQWVKALHKDGRAESLDWRAHYEALRAALGLSAPGYMIHEAVAWSPHHRKWFVFPRRLSKEAYDDAADEARGGNTVIVAAHDFSTIAAAPVGTRTPTRGFSSVKFLPGSHDTVVLALKSEENAAAGTQASFLAVYALQPDGAGWKTLLEETPLPIARKFEGVEVLSEKVTGGGGGAA